MVPRGPARRRTIPLPRLPGEPALRRAEPDARFPDQPAPHRRPPRRRGLPLAARRNGPQVRPGARRARGCASRRASCRRVSSIERVLTEIVRSPARPAKNPLYAISSKRCRTPAPSCTAADKQALEARCVESHRARRDAGLSQADRASSKDSCRGPTTDDGVWKLPDGDAYYAYRLRSQTTTHDDAGRGACARPFGGGAHRGRDDAHPRRAGAAAARRDAGAGAGAAGQGRRVSSIRTPTTAARQRSPTTRG